MAQNKKQRQNVAIFISIEPRAELPSDMKENYHFGKM